MSGSRPSNFALTSPGRLRLFSTKELFALPPPTWLIDHHVPRGGVVGVYGPSNQGKSFIAIDMALCVAAGVPWNGLDTQQGYVVYIAAEGGYGLPQRVRAWLHHHKRELNDLNIAWLVESVQVNNDADDLDQIIKRLHEEIQEDPILIIIDTLARCFDGDENTQRDMGRFIAGVDRMRHEFGSTVVIVHHTNAVGSRERGNSAFRGAAETMMAITQDPETQNINVVCDKQRDAAWFTAFELALQVDPQFESAVVVPATQLKSTILLDWLRIGPLTYTELKARANEVGSGISESSMKRHLMNLKQTGVIVKENGIYRLKDQ